MILIVTCTFHLMVVIFVIKHCKADFKMATKSLL